MCSTGDPHFKINEISQLRNEEVVARAKIKVKKRIFEDKNRIRAGARAR